MPPTHRKSAPPAGPRRLALAAALASATVGCLAMAAQQPDAPPPATAPAAAATQAPRPPRVVRLGVQTPGVSKQLDALKKDAVFPVEGTPDWSVVTADAVWVSSARANHVVQLLAANNTVGLIVDVQRPCSGIAEAFGSIWVPSCGSHSIDRLDPKTGALVTTIPADPSNSEGGITSGAGAVWFVTKGAKLIRIDPKSNAVTASYDIPSGSDNPVFADGAVWISSFEHDSVVKVDAKSGKVLLTVATGPKPRFITVGAGSVWTLNQGDGSVSRVDLKSGKLLATIPCGIQGGGGELKFGGDRVWATMFDFPLTEIDPKTNTVVAQWAGQGGDGMSAGLGSVWLSNLRQGNVWRIPYKQD